MDDNSGGVGMKKDIILPEGEEGKALSQLLRQHYYDCAIIMAIS